MSEKAVVSPEKVVNSKKEASAKQAESSRSVAVVAVVDVVGALADDTLSGNVYYLDSNKANGSKGIGTENLSTAVKKGDKLIWTIQALECEAYVSIENIAIDNKICEPEKQIFKGTDVVYWVGDIKTDITEPVPYNIGYKVGNRPETLSSAVSFCQQPVA